MRNPVTDAAAQRLQLAGHLLGDGARRDYSTKLRLFNEFAERELRQAIGALQLRPGMHVLDVGCGTGDALPWLWEYVAPQGSVVGLDLAHAHAATARATAPAQILVVQADLLDTPFTGGSFDLIWCVNTLHHCSAPGDALSALVRLLRPNGRVVIGQSSYIPDMYFAWDARLERIVDEAVRQYYRDRYALDERRLASIRSNVGLLRAAGLRDVQASTLVIERTSPLTASDERYLLQAIFRDTWGERLERYLSAEDGAQLRRLCDPRSTHFALHRPDFHFMQTFTLTVGQVPPAR